MALIPDENVKEYLAFSIQANDCSKTCLVGLLHRLYSKPCSLVGEILLNAVGSSCLYVEVKLYNFINEINRVQFLI